MVGPVTGANWERITWIAADIKIHRITSEIQYTRNPIHFFQSSVLFIFEVFLEWGDHCSAYEQWIIALYLVPCNMETEEE